jgi:hypothetical protein
VQHKDVALARVAAGHTPYNGSRQMVHVIPKKSACVRVEDGDDLDSALNILVSLYRLGVLLSSLTFF